VGGKRTLAKASIPEPCAAAHTAATAQARMPAGWHLTDQSPKVPSLLPTASAQVKQTAQSSWASSRPLAPSLLPIASEHLKQNLCPRGVHSRGIEKEPAPYGAQTAESSWAGAAQTPLQGQLFLDGEELIVPDPALGLLNCLCERTVAVCHPAESALGHAFVDVCIDCGQVHRRASNQ